MSYFIVCLFFQEKKKVLKAAKDLAELTARRRSLGNIRLAFYTCK
jgi:hypothetical protein